MQSPVLSRFFALATLVAGLGAVVGCATKPTTATTLEPAVRKKVERGVVEPGFTPEMVYLALGKPTVPAESLSDATRNGTWEYHRFATDKRDFIRSGFRQRVVFDPSRGGDVVVTEPVDDRVFPHLRDHALVITFREGRVTEITRIDRS